MAAGVPRFDVHTDWSVWYGVPETHAARTDITRTKLLGAAFAEVYRHGFQAASLNGIVAAAGVTKGALFHHFAGKQALGYALVDEVVGPLLMERWLAPLATTDDPIAALQGSIRRYIGEDIASGRPGYSSRLTALATFLMQTGFIPAGRYAVVVHRGHPDRICQSLQALEAWGARHGVAWQMNEWDVGQEVWRGRFEFHLTDAAARPDPAEWSIEIAYLVHEPAARATHDSTSTS
jgi:AcrR family transcriptional regulator